MVIREKWRIIYRAIKRRLEGLSLCRNHHSKEMEQDAYKSFSLDRKIDEPSIKTRIYKRAQHESQAR